MKSKARLPLFLVLLLIIVGLLVWWFIIRREEVQNNRIFGSGTIEATEVDATSKVSGKIVKLLVDEGDLVKKGQLIAVLDSQELQAQVNQARAALQAAEQNLAELRAGSRIEDIQRVQAQYKAALDAANQAKANLDLALAGTRIEEINQAKASVEQAKVTLANADTDLKRIEMLVSQGAAPQQQLDTARTQRDSLAAQLEVARQRLKEAQAGSRPQQIEAAKAAYTQANSQAQAAKAALDLVLAGPRPQTIAAAAAAADQARAALLAAETMLGYTKIYAPVSGGVTLRSLELGELAVPGAPIVRIAELDSVWLRVYIPEPEMDRVKLGQQAEITTDAYANNTYSGRVTEIAQEAEFTPKNVQTRPERVKLVFGVKITATNPGGQLKPGMLADAYILVGTPEESK